MISSNSLVHRAGYLLLALAMLPVLVLGLAAGLVLFAYAVLEELADSTTGTAPAPIDESQARETARRLMMGYER